MKKMKLNQRGVASIVIVVVLITVITLIVLGFAAVVRREQRQALDQQLSAQARFAAESAINEVIARFRSDPASIVNQPNCQPTPTNTFTAANTDEIKTTCVRVLTSPGRLDFDEVSPDNSTLVWLDPGTQTLDRIVITWQQSRTTSGSCWSRAYNQLPTDIPAAEIGLLRFDLAHAGPNGSTFSRDSLRMSQLGGLLFPRSTGATASLAWTPPAVWPGGTPPQPVVFGACDTDPATPASTPDTYNAYAIIDVPNNNSRYMLRLRGVYRSSAVRVMGFTPAPDNSLVMFQGVQISIEATSRVGDIVQRVQVRVPANTPPDTLMPDEALHVGGSGVCKAIQTDPNFNTADGC